jgi:hypothetical protein
MTVAPVKVIDFRDVRLGRRAGGCAPSDSPHSLSQSSVGFRGKIKHRYPALCPQ